MTKFRSRHTETNSPVVNKGLKLQHDYYYYCYYAFMCMLWHGGKHKLVLLSDTVSRSCEHEHGWLLITVDALAPWLASLNLFLETFCSFMAYRS